MAQLILSAKWRAFVAELSHAAQAVWNAFNDAYEVQEPLEDMGQPIAAALRAASGQVVPEQPMVVAGGRSYEEAWTVAVRDDVRRRFLAIAAELEADR